MNIDDIVDGVFLINLSSSSDKIKSIVEDLKRNQINAIKIEPTLSSRLNLEVITEEMRDGVKSLDLTTKSIIDYAKISRLKKILIIEDCVNLSSDQISRFLSDYETFSKNVDNWDFIHLNSLDGRKAGEKHISSFSRSICSECTLKIYMVDEGVYDLFLHLLEYDKKPLKDLTKDIHKSRINSYVYEINSDVTEFI